jgi:SlyX protein
MKGTMMNEDCDKRQLDDASLDERLVLRMNELEIRTAFLDDLVDALNATVAEQAQQLMDLQSQFKLLYSRFESNGKDEGIEPYDAASEIPPHY